MCLSVVLATVLAGGCVLSGFLNVYPFLNMSGGLGATINVDLTMVFMVIVSSTIACPLGAFLSGRKLNCLRAVIFVLMVTTLIRLVRVALGGCVPSLCGTLNVCLPLVAAGYTILNIAVLGVARNCAFLRNLMGSFNSNMNFLMTVMVFTKMERGLRATSVPGFLRNLPVALITTDLASLSFLNFSNLIRNVFTWKKTFG